MLGLDCGQEDGRRVNNKLNAIYGGLVYELADSSWHRM